MKTYLSAGKGRGYSREMRIRHIFRKKGIVKRLGGYWNYKYDGQYAKGKIHCSCGMCSTKTRKDGYKPSEQRKLNG